jgi:hypothetical protein
MIKLINILKEIVNNVDEIRQKKIYTDDELRDIASQYSGRTEWRLADWSSWQAATDRGDDFINSILPKLRQAKTFEDDELRDIALKYKSKNEWRLSSDQNAYYTALYRGPCSDKITGEEVVCAYYDKEKRRIINNPNANNSFKFYNNITSHMSNDDATSPRMVYLYTFFDNDNDIVGVYIGITTNEEARREEHTTGVSPRFSFRPDESNVYKFIKENPDFRFEYKKLSDPIPLSQAQKLEGEYVEGYRKKGYPILNKAATGGAGKIYIPNSYLIKHVQDWIVEKEAKGEIPYLNDYKKSKNSKLSTIGNRGKEFYKLATKGLVYQLINRTDDELWDGIKSKNTYTDFANSKLYAVARERNLLPQIKQYFKDKTQQ